MDINTILQSKLSEYLKLKYDIDFNDFEIQLTKKDFEGDLTIVIFPLVKRWKITQKKQRKKKKKRQERKRKNKRTIVK